MRLFSSVAAVLHYDASYLLRYYNSKVERLVRAMQEDIHVDGVSVWKVLLSVLGFMVSVLTAGMAYIIVSLHSTQLEVATLSNSRMTTVDGVRLVESVATIKSEITAQNARLGKIEDKLEQTYAAIRR